MHEALVDLIGSYGSSKDTLAKAILEKGFTIPPVPNLKELMDDFYNLIEDAWVFVRKRNLTPLPREQEKNEKYVKDLFEKWEKKLNQRHLMEEDSEIVD